MGVFVTSGRQFLQSILDLRDFVQARCRAGSIGAHGGRSSGIWRAFWNGGHGQQRSSQALAPYGFPYSFFPFLFYTIPLILPSLHISSTHYRQYISHCCSEWINRRPPSYTTDDVDIGQKKRIPTLLRQWLCRVTRLTCGSGSPRRYGSSRGPGAGETFSDIRSSRVSPPTNQPTKHKQSSNVM